VLSKLRFRGGNSSNLTMDGSQPVFLFRKRKERLTLLGIVAAAWVANYLHFTSMGLYEDDWFFAGFPFFVGYRTWMTGSLVDVLIRLKALGRPVQMILIYSLGGFGALTNSLSADYLMAFALFALSGLMAYWTIRLRFSHLVAGLSAFLFVLSPLDTLHPYINIQFCIAPAFIMLFGAILLYSRGRYVLAYVLAFLSLACYESVFVLFCGAPFFATAVTGQQRRRAWRIHLAIVGMLLVGYIASRAIVGEGRLNHVGGGSASMLLPVVYSWVFSFLGSFCQWLHAISRLREANVEAVLYGGLFFVSLIAWLLRVAARPALQGRVARLRGAATGLLFLFLAYPLSYFFFQTAGILYTSGRSTRISSAGTFGFSLFVAVLLAGWIESAKTKAGRISAAVGVSAVVSSAFMYCFIVQNDYVQQWADQRETARQIAALTPDISDQSVIILNLPGPGSVSTVFGRGAPGIGAETFIVEQEFPWMCAGGHPWPKMLVVHSNDWSAHLKLDSDGLLAWSEPIFEGRWEPASGRFRPNRFIALRKEQDGTLIRESQPVFVSGVQVIQLPAAGPRNASLWRQISRNAVVRALFPKAVWATGSAERPVDTQVQ